MTLFYKITPLLLILYSKLTHAAKFYPYGNPCTTDPMYFEDASDILYNLGQFSSIYIKYEGCAYSERTDITSDDANSGSENWYLGFNFKMGANVAYSLYGIKTDQDSWRKCTKGTYIGSFYSKDGLESFAYATGIDLSNYYNGRNLKEEEKEQSYGLYCDENNQIVQASFEDRSTNPIYYSYTVDALSDLNAAFSKVTCQEIYNYGTDASYATDFASDLLTYSDTCTVTDGSQCPDPYGKLLACEKKFQASERSLAAGNGDGAKSRFVFGTLFYAMAALLLYTKINKNRKSALANDGIDRSWIEMEEPDYVMNEKLSKSTSSQTRSMSLFSGNEPQDTPALTTMAQEEDYDQQYVNEDDAVIVNTNDHADNQHDLLSSSAPVDPQSSLNDEPNSVKYSSSYDDVDPLTPRIKNSSTPDVRPSRSTVKAAPVLTDVKSTGLMKLMQSRGGSKSLTKKAKRSFFGSTAKK